MAFITVKPKAPPIADSGAKALFMIKAKAPGILSILMIKIINEVATYKTAINGTI